MCIWNYNNNNNNNNTFYSQCGLQFSLRFSYVINDFLNILRMGIPITHVVYMPWHLGDPLFNKQTNTQDGIYNDGYDFPQSICFLLHINSSLCLVMPLYHVISRASLYLIKLFKVTLFVVSLSMGLCLVGNYSLVNVLEGTACAH